MGPRFGGKREDKEQGKPPSCSDVCSKTLGDRARPASTNLDPSVLDSSLVQKAGPLRSLTRLSRPSTLEFEIHSSAKTLLFVPANPTRTDREKVRCPSFASWPLDPSEPKRGWIRRRRSPSSTKPNYANNNRRLPILPAPAGSCPE